MGGSVILMLARGERKRLETFFDTIIGKYGEIQAPIMGEGGYFYPEYSKNKVSLEYKIWDRFGSIPLCGYIFAWVA